MINRGLGTAIVAVGAAQLLKLPLHKVKTGKWDVRKMFESGGMPSSHSSGVSALAVYTATKYGGKTPEFAIAAMLGIIVMYDAMNIRRYAGETAIRVNDLEADVEKLTGDRLGINHSRKIKRLKEKLGHQPREVIVGSLLGAAVGFIGAITAKRRFKI